MENYPTAIGFMRRQKIKSKFVRGFHWFLLIMAMGTLFTIASGVIVVVRERINEQRQLATLAEMELLKQETLFLQNEIERLSRLHGDTAAQTVEIAHQLQSIIDTAKGKRRIFLMQMVPEALRLQARHNIPASATVGMAIYESAFGGSTLATESHNYFGIKAFSDWSGKRTSKMTRDLGVLRRANFRAYESMREGIDGFAEFLTKKKHYKPAFKYDTGPEFVGAVAKAGYCPDADYTIRVTEIIKRHKLAQLDTIGKTQPDDDTKVASVSSSEIGTK